MKRKTPIKIDMFEIIPVGLKIWIGDDVFEVIDAVKYVRNDGQEVTIPLWSGTCKKCGSVVEYRRARMVSPNDIRIRPSDCGCSL